MRIVFFNPIGEIGGAERVLLLLLAELGKIDPSLERCLILGGDGPLRSEAERLGVPTEVVPMPASLAAFGDSDISGGQGGVFRKVRSLLRAMIAVPATIAYLVRLRRLLRRHAPDILHSNGIKSHLAAALARPRRTQLIWHIHDFLGDRTLVRRLMRCLSGRVSIAVANSEAVRIDAAGIVAPLEVRTIYNGIDVQRFSPGSGDPDALDRPAGLNLANRNPIRIGLVATYARWKGHETFLAAAAEAVRHSPELPLYFYLVGGPIYQTLGSQYSLDELRAVVGRHGLQERVGFVPFQPDTVAVYRALDVVVHASTRREPFGLTIVEAMACSRAVITAAAGGAAEVAEQGVNALTFTPGNVDELVTAMIALAQDRPERERLGQGGRRTSVERFAAVSFAQRFADLYIELGRKGSR